MSEDQQPFFGFKIISMISQVGDLIFNQDENQMEDGSLLMEIVDLWWICGGFLLSQFGDVSDRTCSIPNLLESGRLQNIAGAWMLNSLINWYQDELISVADLRIHTGITKFHCNLCPFHHQLGIFRLLG